MNYKNEFQLALKSLAKQKEILLWFAKFSGVVLIFLFFYLPIQQRLSSSGDNLKSLRNEISDLKKISEGFLNPQEIADLNRRQHLFEQGLMKVSDAVPIIESISSEAEKNHLNLIQIYSDSPVSIKKENGEDLELEGKKLYQLPVSFRVESDMKNLASFFYSLEANSKVVYMVEALQVQKSSYDSQTLQCDVTLSYISI